MLVRSKMHLHTVSFVFAIYCSSFVRAALAVVKLAEGSVEPATFRDERSLSPAGYGPRSEAGGDCASLGPFKFFLYTAKIASEEEN